VILPRYSGAERKRKREMEIPSKDTKKGKGREIKTYRKTKLRWQSPT